MSLSTVSLLVVLFTAGAGAKITFWCDADGVMTLTSFPSKDHKIAFIDNVPTAISGSTELKIDAGKDTAVLVAFSDYDMSSIFAGDTEAYTLQCNEIDAAGVSATVMSKAAASISTELNTVIPTFPILLGFVQQWDNYVQLTSVVVGMWARIKIQIPDVYKMDVERCDGYAAHEGQKVTDVPPIPLLGYNGCSYPSNDDYIDTLMLNFLSSSLDAAVQRYRVYYSWLRAFKFFGHDSFLLECSIIICPIDGTCGVDDWTWCFRRKRSYSKPKDDGSFSVITRSVIKVLDPYTLGTASILSVNISAFLLSTLALLLVLQ